MLGALRDRTAVHRQIARELIRQQFVGARERLRQRHHPKVGLARRLDSHAQLAGLRRAIIRPGLVRDNEQHASGYARASPPPRCAAALLPVLHRRQLGIEPRTPLSLPVRPNRSRRWGRLRRADGIRGCGTLRLIRAMIQDVRGRGHARVGPVMLALTLLVTFGLTLLVAFGIGRTAAASQPPQLVPRSGFVAGRSYGQWLAAAYRWRLALPGVTSNRTSCFTRSQHGPVWFLNGSEVTGTAVTRTCAIPPGRYLMLLVPGIDCSTIEPPPVHADDQRWPAALRQNMVDPASRTGNRDAQR